MFERIDEVIQNLRIQKGGMRVKMGVRGSETNIWGVRE